MNINANHDAKSFYDFQKKLDEKIYQIDENAFVDGVINFEKYSANPLKIMWILKEPNSDDSGLDWREEIGLIPTYNGNLGAFEKTFAPIVYISHGLIHKKKWNEINWIEDEPEIVNSLEEIAFININKSPGGASSNDTFLQNQYQNYYKKIVREQIINFKPNVIIGGNTIKFLKEDLKEIYPSLNYEKHVEGTNLGISISKEDNLIVFDAYHPQYYKSAEKKERYCSDIIDNYLLITQNNQDENN